MKTKHKIVTALLLLILCGCGVCFFGYRLKTIEIEGCSMTSEDEIRKNIEEEAWMQNTLVMILQNKLHPFQPDTGIAKMDLSCKSPHTIHVRVYEKTVAGCLDYMDQYIYFDNDGIVLKTSAEKMDGVLCVYGLDISEWTLGEKLPLKDTTKFKKILSLTQRLQKDHVQVDSMRFSREDGIVLQKDNIRVLLGKESNLPEQIGNLKSILEALAGKSGTLDMKKYDGSRDSASFEEDRGS